MEAERGILVECMSKSVKIFRPYLAAQLAVSWDILPVLWTVPMSANIQSSLGFSFGFWDSCHFIWHSTWQGGAEEARLASQAALPTWAPYTGWMPGPHSSRVQNTLKGVLSLLRSPCLAGKWPHAQSQPDVFCWDVRKGYFYFWPFSKEHFLLIDDNIFSTGF